jgi:GT2 family glycosyltransferase
MITAAIVLYKENEEILKKTVISFLNTPIEKKLFLIDNSPTNKLGHLFQHKDIEYVFMGSNIGFANAHNFVIENLNSTYHLILNPDIEFTALVIPKLIEEIEMHKRVSFISPKVLYPNNEIQYVCRKHPTFLDLLNRKLKVSKSKIFENEYRNQDLEKPFYPDFIHGCFMLFKTQEFKKLGGFDHRFFLYLEDADICRTIYETGNKILFYPKVVIIHHLQKGSSKSIKLFFRHLSSAFKYFLKWGF